MIFFNVVLAYGMETSFRFYNKETDKIVYRNDDSITILDLH
jgi:hypothetical protein